MKFDNQTKLTIVFENVEAVTILPSGMEKVSLFNVTGITDEIQFGHGHWSTRKQASNVYFMFEEDLFKPEHFDFSKMHGADIEDGKQFETNEQLVQNVRRHLLHNQTVISFEFENDKGVTERIEAPYKSDGPSDYLNRAIGCREINNSDNGDIEYLMVINENIQDFDWEKHTSI